MLEICKAQGVFPMGEFRDTGVGITGTNWRPKLNLFCWIQRNQMFKDGNKRVASLVANKEMIKNGLGILSVPVERIGEYESLLVKYYETNDSKDFKKIYI